MRYRTSWFVPTLLFLGASICGAAAQPPELAQRVDAIFAEYAKPGSPGCALAVVRDGRIVYEKGYGLANLEHGVPIDPKRTVFDIGSTSKQFTAACILLLEQDKKLALDDDIRKFLPELPDLGTPVTVRHLLHHTGGFRDYIHLMMMGGFAVEDYTTAQDALAALGRQKALDFPPGSEHSYSNSGYFLLAQIVERASGKPLREFAQERIFGPLGMSQTRFLDDHTAVVPHRAASYGPNPAGGFAVQMSNWEQTGDGAVQTTVGDLAKWDRNFYEPKVGGRGLIEQLQTTGTLNSGEKLQYARGLVVDEYRGLHRVSHSGAWAGYRADLMRFPEQKFSVIALCNLATAEPSGLARQVTDLYLAGQLGAEPVTPPAQAQAPATANLGETDRYTGLYWSRTSNLIRRIEAKEGKLVYWRNPESESALAPLGGDRFRMLGVPTSTEVSFPAPRQMVVATGDNAPIRFEQVKPASLQPEDFAAYAGTYASEEVDTTWTLQAKDGKLSLLPKRGPAGALEPAFADAFVGYAGLLHFQRDGAGKITGFSLDAGRARDLKFVKQPG